MTEYRNHLRKLPDRLALLLLAGGLAILALLWWSAVRGAPQRLAALAAPLMIWLAMLWFARRRRVLRWVVALLPLVFAAPFLLPGREIPADKVLDRYQERIVRLEGTEYVWGGECGNGIDCSGLPRKALRESLFLEGLGSFNGNATRAALRHWWFDASAHALMNGYRGYAKPLGITGTVRTIDYSKLLPGDFVITRDGRHVMCYLDGNRWIQADPGPGRVITLDGRGADNSWFDAPVAAFRWTVLDRAE